MRHPSGVRMMMARAVERVFEAAHALVQVFEQHHAQGRHYRVEADLQALGFKHRAQRFMVGQKEIIAQHQPCGGSKQAGQHAAVPNCHDGRRHEENERQAGVLRAEQVLAQ